MAHSPGRFTIVTQYETRIILRNTLKERAWQAAGGDGSRKRDARAGSGVQSVGIAAKVLKALAAHGGDLPLKDLAAATAMPRAKVHRYLASLRGAGLIAQDPETGRYQIGAAAVTIGLVGLGRLSPVRQLQEALPRLRERDQRDRDGGDLGRARADHHRDRGERSSRDDERSHRHRAAAA